MTPPAWLHSLSLVYGLLSIASALYVLADILLLGRRQRMWIMEVVWPLTLLYWGPLGLPFYWRIGRRRGERPMWQYAFAGATHCGAGCALGDFIGDWLVFALGFTLFGSDLLGKFLFGFVLAYLFGIAFQYFSVAPMRGLGLWDGIVAAVKIDTLSLLAYQVGMFGWMALRAWMLPGLQPTQWTYWFMMQIAMVLGFWTTFPVNWWLIARGIKERM
ncbi:DUF4396 domain-containing protein [Roseicella sp. DB1501]|uniref:DUF4396 domain-containing protein n=1 Tax=Roseicella sp. DB1501 TaxID=2730925 RepID=UPI0014925608|nr:DUF4396 domain-containing protein [Roseicella sp. DB1501]NOG69537.1 DUF4396 domain-containing protein [Roseicella sp. DB1501]